MEFFITHSDKIIKLTQEPSESEPAFIDRVKFMVCAMDNDMTPERANTLGHAYKNKMQSYTKYPPEVEFLLQKIEAKM